MDFRRNCLLGGIFFVLSGGMHYCSRKGEEKPNAVFEWVDAIVLIIYFHCSGIETRGWKVKILHKKSLSPCPENTINLINHIFYD